MVSILNIPVSNRLLMGIFLMFLTLSSFVTGCQSAGEAEPNVQIEWEIEPNPPAVGMATINITLKDSTNQLISGANVELEGNMSHPGMQPVLATAEEVETGKYSADIEFTMGGDWFFLINSTLPDNQIVERQININGVRSQ